MVHQARRVLEVHSLSGCSRESGSDSFCAYHDAAYDIVEFAEGRNPWGVSPDADIEKYISDLWRTYISDEYVDLHRGLEDLEGKV